MMIQTKTSIAKLREMMNMMPDELRVKIKQMIMILYCRVLHYFIIFQVISPKCENMSCIVYSNCTIYVSVMGMFDQVVTDDTRH